MLLSHAYGQFVLTEFMGVHRERIMNEIGEAELLAAGRAGILLERGDDKRRSVDAALLRRYCQELKHQIDPHGLRLRNITVVRSLDLSGLEVPSRCDSRAAGLTPRCSRKAPSCMSWR